MPKREVTVGLRLRSETTIKLPVSVDVAQTYLATLNTDPKLRVSHQIMVGGQPVMGHWLVTAASREYIGDRAQHWVTLTWVAP
jgi:hypothetical protein